MSSEMIRVLIADDSPFVCGLLRTYLEANPSLEVVATVHDGREAVRKVRELRPDVATLDLEMPEMDGLEALLQIMRNSPTPVVVISGVSGRAATMTHQALDLGAVDFVLKYAPGIDTNPEALRNEIVAKVEVASKIRIIRSLAPSAIRPGRAQWNDQRATPERLSLDKTEQIKNIDSTLPGGIVIIGASTGGPLALRQFLGELPADFPAVVVVVQHLPKAFTSVLAAQLARHTRLRVKEAASDDRLRPGVALIAPGGVHLLLRPNLQLTLQPGPAVDGHCPSIDVCMQSAGIYGDRVTGVLLTGMGADGAMGLASIRAKGGVTYAQDRESCIVDAMPQKAIQAGVVDHVAPPAQIAQQLLERLPRETALRRQAAC
jgi:two-component system chemotaxis response regulator CheB